MNLRYTRRALADLDAARDYIAERNPQAARLFGARLRGAIEELRAFPERGRPGRVAGTRELVVPRTPYVVAYRIEAASVDILAILHGARRWPAGLD